MQRTNPSSIEESNIDSREYENEVVIAYSSKQLTDTQLKWSTTEKEEHAVAQAIITFYHYLYESDFTIVTDHRLLEYLMSKKEPAGRLAGWSFSATIQSLDQVPTRKTQSKW